jgi:ABC-type multidrug transport system fused ATPase/permease subunit
VGLGVLAAKAAAGVYATYVQVRIAGEVGGALRLRLFDSLLALHPLRQLRQTDQGATALDDVSPATKAVVGLTERVRDVEVGLSHGVLGGLRALGQLVPIALLLCALAPRLAGAAALALAAFGWSLGLLRGAYRQANRRAAVEHERLVETTDDCVRHADLWVTYGAQAKARATVQRLGSAIARGAATLEARGIALSGANEVLGAAALVVAMAASLAGSFGAADEGPTMLAFAVAFFLAYRPLRDVAEARLALARAGIAYESIAPVLARGEAAAEEAPAAPPRTWRLGDLELRGLALARGESQPVTARVAGGAVAVIVGPTGVGKTTLVRTLLGLERPAAGQILFAGEPLDHAPPGSHGRPFAWVPQDAPLLADTLSANVTLGDDGADVGEALSPIGAFHLVSELGDARLGAGGRAVSGGERQWIALARAIASRQPVLVLDEPTSGLDARSQERVLEALGKLRGRRTVIMVTHRPEPLRIADVVVRLGPATVPAPA